LSDDSYDGSSHNQRCAYRCAGNLIADFARCYVTIGPTTGSVVGYYTLSAIAVERRDLPGRLHHNAPNLVPAILLGRLAVDKEAQGVGVGSALVRDALLRTVSAGDAVGAKVIVIQALNARAAAFYEAIGFDHSPTDPLHLHLSLADARATLDNATHSRKHIVGAGWE